MKGFIILMGVLLASCESPQGRPGESKDITESKKRGVFFLEYTVNSNPYKINDSLQLTVKEAWVEQRWNRGDNYDKTSPSAGYQLCIATTKKDMDAITYPYITIGIDGSHYLRESSEESYIGDFTAIPVDTIEYLVQRGHNLIDDSTQKKEIIGKLLLVRK